MRDFLSRPCGANELGGYPLATLTRRTVPRATTLAPNGILRRPVIVLDLRGGTLLGRRTDVSRPRRALANWCRLRRRGREDRLDLPLNDLLLSHRDGGHESEVLLADLRGLDSGHPDVVPRRVGAADVRAVLLEHDRILLDLIDQPSHVLGGAGRGQELALPRVERGDHRLGLGADEATSPAVDGRTGGREDLDHLGELFPDLQGPGEVEDFAVDGDNHLHPRIEPIEQLLEALHVASLGLNCRKPMYGTSFSILSYFNPFVKDFYSTKKGLKSPIFGI